MSDPATLIFEKGAPGRCGIALPNVDVPAKPVGTLLPGVPVRGRIGLPECAEFEVTRHYVNLSTLNHHLDKGFYPLGSCTMKYNPKVNEGAARMPAYAGLHPLAPESWTRGALAVQWELVQMLREITGLDAVSLQPAAGAQGELTGLLVIRAYLDSIGQGARDVIVFPDSAHGTNPASAAIAGFRCRQIASGADGLVDLEALRAACDNRVAAFMLTNPNTLGLFETQIADIATLVHGAGGQMYMDGANLNALLGIARPGDLGFDVSHLNLHKTFSTPHGGGGPGSGPIAVRAHLERFLPKPHLVMGADDMPRYESNRPDSIGKVHGFGGNFGMHIRAWTYMKALGASGLAEVGPNAILNANYLMALLEPHFERPYAGRPMHEIVLSGIRLKAHGLRTLDLAKRILDFGMHAPTVYFPLNVPEAIMIEPTETESKETIEEFADAMIQIVREAETEPDLVRNAPYTTPVGRLNDAKAVKELNIRWRATPADMLSAEPTSTT